MNNARRLPAIAHSAAAEALATAGEGDRTLRKGNTAARTVKPNPLYREGPPVQGRTPTPAGQNAKPCWEGIVFLQRRVSQNSEHILQ